MARQRDGFRRRAVTLLEVLIALTILSTVLLPVGMFMVEYLRGSSELGEYHQVMNILEEKMETALALPFDALPVGRSKNVRLGHDADETGKRSVTLDLRPVQVGVEEVGFELEVEPVPLEFSAVADPDTGRMERTRLEASYKRLILRAGWGSRSRHNLDLVAYKADL
ncbi:MAG TPA: prepilin-type N-terminal cleavage/methylation domain-containing protein [Candidatus Ozemobacteraceae bacterium]|nr:prepilin-type N-terminal cleavage/methylation domain-containing protein [Candidatus Ozemobacteraceae bacterium]